MRACALVGFPSLHPIYRRIRGVSAGFGQQNRGTAQWSYTVRGSWHGLWSSFNPCVSSLPPCLRISSSTSQSTACVSLLSLTSWFNAALIARPSSSPGGAPGVSLRPEPGLLEPRRVLPRHLNSAKSAEHKNHVVVRHGRDPTPRADLLHKLGTLTVAASKTDASRRVIDRTPAVLAELEILIGRAPEEPTALLFEARSGRKDTRHNARRMLDTAVEKANVQLAEKGIEPIPKVGLHGLRRPTRRYAAPSATTSPTRPRSSATSTPGSRSAPTRRRCGAGRGSRRPKGPSSTGPPNGHECAQTTARAPKSSPSMSCGEAKSLALAGLSARRASSPRP